MIFENRREAGIKLSQELAKYNEDANTLVVAIPRGGVEVAFYLCQKLKLNMEVTLARKIGAPFNKELAIAAVNERGGLFLNKEIINSLDVSQEYIKEESEKEKKEIEKRIGLFRNNRPLASFNNRKIIIVDDGIATGATIKAIIKLIKDDSPKEIIVAVPVAAPDSIREIEKDCDQVISLFCPPDFQAVGAYFREFNQVEDEQAINLINKINENE